MLRAEIRADSKLRRNYTAFPLLTTSVVYSSIYRSAQTVVVPAIKKKHRDNDTPYTNATLNSITAKKTIPLREVEVGAYTSYALDIELGNEPHTEPYFDIVNWLVKKFGYSLVRAGSAATAIIEKIKNDGINPQPFVVPAFEDVSNDYFKTVVSLSKRGLGL